MSARFASITVVAASVLIPAAVVGFAIWVASMNTDPVSQAVVVALGLLHAAALIPFPALIAKI